MIEQILTNNLLKAIVKLYGQELPVNLAQVQKTRPEFTGDFTIVVFPLLRISKKGPEQTADDIGSYMIDKLREVTDYNIIKGFLNLLISDAYQMSFFHQNANNHNFGRKNKESGDPNVIEY